MFLLVPAHPGFPGQIPQSRKTVVCVCSDGLRVRIKFMGQYGRPNLALAGLLVTILTAPSSRHVSPISP